MEATGTSANAGHASEDLDSLLARLPVRILFEVPVHAVTQAEVVHICRIAAETHRSLCVAVVNAAKVVNMRTDAELRQSVLSANLILADGMSLVWASRLLGRNLPERVAGIDLLQALLAMAAEEGFSVYLLGAEPAVLDEAQARIQDLHPRIRIVGSRHGFFSDEEAAGIAKEIASSDPDFLFVGVPSPKKEMFLAKWGAKANARVCHGVGGSFDVIAGRVRRAPLAVQRLGLEWLYRVSQEPLRLWRRYLVTNTIFLWLLIGELLRPTRNRASR